MLSHRGFPLFRQLGVLHVFLETEGMRADFYRFRFAGREGVGCVEKQSGIDYRNLTKKVKSLPFMVILTGNGIVSKSVVQENDSGIRRIKENPELFWQERKPEGKTPEIVFMRKQRQEELMTVFRENGIPVVWVGLGKKEIPDGMVADWFAKNNGPGCLWKNGPGGELLAALLFRRWLLPFSVGILVLLVGNLSIHSRLRERYDSRQQEWDIKMKSVETERGETKKNLELFREVYGPKQKYFAGIADEIGGNVPEGMVLTELEFSPLKGKPEKGKPLEFRKQGVIVRGRAGNTGEVVLFVRRLAGLKEFRKFCMTALDQKKESANFQFEIELIP